MVKQVVGSLQFGTNLGSSRCRKHIRPSFSVKSRRTVSLPFPSSSRTSRGGWRSAASFLLVLFRVALLRRLHVSADAHDCREGGEERNSSARLAVQAARYNSGRSHFPIRAPRYPTRVVDGYCRVGLFSQVNLSSWETTIRQAGVAEKVCWPFCKLLMEVKGQFDAGHLVNVTELMQVSGQGNCMLFCRTIRRPVAGLCSWAARIDVKCAFESIYGLLLKSSSE